MWRRTRTTVEATVKQAATSMVDYAQQVLPKSLPRIELPKVLAPAAKARREARAQDGVRTARPAKKAKRTKRA